MGIQIDCVIHHDVDLLPETDMNRYECGEWTNESPRHISVAVRKTPSVEIHKTTESTSLTASTRGYEIYYDFLIGGVLCIRPKVYMTINGFSNEYYNWGGEDDGRIFDNYSLRTIWFINLWFYCNYKDMGMRMRARNVCVRRPPAEFSSYKMSPHKKSEENPIRDNLLFGSVKRMYRDGLVNIRELSSVVDFKQYALYTKILINVGSKSVWSQVI